MLKKPLLNTIAQILGKAVTVAISLVTTGILTRKLGASIYGSYTLVTSVFIFLDSLADFGTKIIGVREASQKNEEERKIIYVQTAWLRLIMTGAAFVLGIILIFSWSGFSSIKTESLVSLVMIWFTSIAGSLEIIFQTRLRMDLKVLTDILFPLIFLGALWQNGSNITLLWVFGMYLAARIISLFFGLGMAARIEKNIKIKKPDKEFLKEMFKASWPMGMYLLVFASYDRAVDSMLIDRMIGIKEVAWYGLAYKIYGNLLQPAYFFVASIFPLLSSKMEKKRQLFFISAGLLGLGLLIAVPIIYELAPWIISVLAGNGYEMSATVLRILLAAMIFSYLGHLIGFSVISKGGQKIMLIVGSLVLIFNIAMNLWAIPRFGIIGAAWVTVATEGLSLLLMSGQLWNIVKKT